MLASLEYNTPGYANSLLDLIIKGASAKTFLNPSDVMALRIQANNLPGFNFEGDTATVELGLGHPQGFGNYFETQIIKSTVIRKGTVQFEGKYPDEEFLGYTIDNEDGYLLTEDGELIVLA